MLDIIHRVLSWYVPYRILRYLCLCDVRTRGCKYEECVLFVYICASISFPLCVCVSVNMFVQVYILL